MTSNLVSICEKVLVVQEGGYNVDVMGQHASGVVRALLHDQQSGIKFEIESRPGLSFSKPSAIKLSKPIKNDSANP